MSSQPGRGALGRRTCTPGIEPLPLRLGGFVGRGTLRCGRGGGVRRGTEPSIAWIDVVLLFFAVAGLGATLVVMPSVSTTLNETVWVILRPVQDLSASLRLDVIAAVGLVLILTVGLDSLLGRWRPPRRAPTEA